MEPTCISKQLFICLDKIFDEKKNVPIQIFLLLSSNMTICFTPGQHRCKGERLLFLWQGMSQRVRAEVVGVTQGVVSKSSIRHQEFTSWNPSEQTKITTPKSNCSSPRSFHSSSIQKKPVIFHLELQQLQVYIFYLKR